MDNDNETFILLLLADSNLPTGSFVASSGFESYLKHGFHSTTSSTSTVTFTRNSLMAYSHSALPFVSDAHRVVSQFSCTLDRSDSSAEDIERAQEKALTVLSSLDSLYHTMILNHVSRRASKAQGIALLNLFSKSFSTPSDTGSVGGIRATRMNHLLDRLKLLVRKEEVHGHLPICWGALTAALSLSLERSQFLHLFLHARSLLSAAVRLNHIGPYHAQQLLMYTIRPMISLEAFSSKDLRTGLLESPGVDFDEINDGPANTWPLGEILSGRHDLQHSRIFNS